MTRIPIRLFEPGRIYATTGAKATIDAGAITAALDRHLAGAFGETYEEDARVNMHAMETGERILSEHQDVNGVKFWIETTASRDRTLVLLPNEY